MEQFRQVGEVLGGLKALMVLQHDISINPRQCRLLVDMLELAFDTISDEIRRNLNLSDRSTKWKSIELPMKELHRIFKEADIYVRQCMDTKDWLGRAISLHMNQDCVETHIHNLLSCFPVVIEAIEMASEISGVDEDDIQRRRVAIMQKYDPNCDDYEHFLWKFGRQYLVTRDVLSRIETAYKEDRWLLLERIREKKMKVGEVLNRKLTDNSKLLSSGVLVKTGDYFVRRRLGGNNHLKEIHWLGESLALRTFYGDITQVMEFDISLVLSLSHPNVLQYLCAFYEEDRKEGFLVMELMSKDLGSHMKEHSGQKNKIPFTIPVAVDIMLQIARGMEYLHSKNICLGDLNPTNILLKAKNTSIGGFQVKVTGFGMNSIKSSSTRVSSKPPTTPIDLNIWLAPEVLEKLDQPKNKLIETNTEKADVYSFGMLCFELLTGKVPFEDSHLQGEKMVRNILAGERPLFSYPFPKYLQNLTRKCWQTNPEQRPSFSSLSRILRYIKKNLVMNPNHGDPESPPLLVDYCDMEAGYLKRFPGENGVVLPVSNIPFQMFMYAIFEKQKVCSKKPEVSMFGDENLAAMDDLFLVSSGRRSYCSEIIDSRNSTIGVDMRSVISETPHRKFRQSLGSLISERKEADQNSVITIRNIENKTSDQHLTSQDKVAEIQPAATPPRTQEHVKSAMPKAIEQKVDKTNILEVKNSLRPIVDHKQTASTKPSEGESLKQVLSVKELPEIPEKKIVDDKNETNQKSISTPPITTQKNKDPTYKSDQKTDDSDKPTKKNVLLKRLKDFKNKRNQGSPNNNSENSEASKTKKTKHFFSPASSPSRSFMSTASSPFKNCVPTGLPRSPARTTKTALASSSPARALRTNPLTSQSKEHSSPLWSTSRIARQTSLS